MEEIIKEFGEVGSPSMGEITTLVYGSKYGLDESDPLKDKCSEVLWNL